MNEALTTGYVWLDLFCITGALFMAMLFGAMLERHEEKIVRWLEVLNKRLRGEVEPYTLSWWDGERKTREILAVDDREAREKARDLFPGAPPSRWTWQLTRGPKPSPPVTSSPRNSGE